MRKEYDMATAARGPVLRQSGKTRITILLDQEVVDSFRRRAKDTGRGYQTAINQALREYLARHDLGGDQERRVGQDKNR